MHRGRGGKGWLTAQDVVKEHGVEVGHANGAKDTVGVLGGDDE